MEDETHGIQQVGEVPVVIRRDSSVEADHRQAYRSGREAAFREVAEYANARHRQCGPYDDTRPWIELRLLLNDKLREALSGSSES